MKLKIAIIGGGAAGFFAAITASNNNSNAEVTIIEKTSKLLAKVKISGGGRCNVTNATFENYQLIKNYPRGSKELKKAFNFFSVKDTIEWFESKGVPLKKEEDGRYFPTTDDSQTIIDCLMNECKKLKIKVLNNTAVKSIVKLSENDFSIETTGETLVYNKIIIAVGGNPKSEFYDFLQKLGHSIIPPVPSLFTFNIPDSKYNDLQGISVNTAIVKITGLKSEQTGPILITHWGLSGPGVLKLSAWEARKLHELNYNFTIQVNWIPGNEEEPLRASLKKFKTEHPKKTISSNPLFNLPRRLWERQTEIAGISSELKWGDIPDKSINKLIEELIRSSLDVKGKTTFKEEFVTCGGVKLEEVNFETLESIICKGLYFAGEVLDIDGITGGFNFQNAWTTGYLAGKSSSTINN
jgi:predicted Rossmann fold flavoprotein